MPNSWTSRPFRLLTAALVVTGLLATAPLAEAKPATVKVMTRNLYLGADLLPATRGDNFAALVSAAGGILQQVDENDFRIRAKGLAAEIQAHKPDLVGLQEVALWRTEPCDRNPLLLGASTVRYDFLKLLLAQLNKGTARYRTAVSKPEFDFEVWVNTDGNEATSAPNCPFGSELNGRLTMRDVILARKGTVKTSSPKSGTFDTLLQVKPGGFGVNVTRGWTSVDAKVGTQKIHFVNSHFEAFDNAASNATNKNTSVGNGEIRAAQAAELVEAGGPATSKLPVVALGDFNSDVRTEVKPGDALAYRALLDAGFKERAATRPFGCCIKTDILKTSAGGKVTDFDHVVDHVMTNRPKKVRLIRSDVTGRKPANGYWDSDHAGVFSVLRVG